MPFICVKCGAVLGCKLAVTLHVFTTHFHQDVCVHPDAGDEETGESCIACLLDRTVPIEDYWRHLGINLERGNKQ